VTVKADYGALFQIQWVTLTHHAGVEGVEQRGPVEQKGPAGEAWVHQVLGEPVTNDTACHNTIKLLTTVNN